MLNDSFYDGNDYDYNSERKTYTHSLTPVASSPIRVGARIPFDSLSWSLSTQSDITEVDTSCSSLVCIPTQSKSCSPKVKRPSVHKPNFTVKPLSITTNYSPSLQLTDSSSVFYTLSNCNDSCLTSLAGQVGSDCEFEFNISDNEKKKCHSVFWLRKNFERIAASNKENRAFVWVGMFLFRLK